MLTLPEAQYDRIMNALLNIYLPFLFYQKVIQEMHKDGNEGLILFLVGAKDLCEKNEPYLARKLLQAFPLE